MGRFSDAGFRKAINKKGRNQMEAVSKFAAASAMACLIWAAPVRAEGMKVAVVDMAKLVRAHPDTQSAESLLEKQMDEFEAEQKDAEAQYDKLRKEYEDAKALSENKALTDAARGDKRAEAEAKREALRSYEAKASEMLNMRRREINDQKVRIQKRIVSKVLEAVRAYAVKNGYALVLDSAGMSISGVEMVLFSSEQIDITGELVKIVSAMPASGVERGKAKNAGASEKGGADTRSGESAGGK